MLYLLHGCCDPHGSWTGATDVEELSADSDLLVVLPEGGRIGFYSDWARGDRWETFHLVELRQILEQRYRAGPARAVGGLSMGGFGALAYAARHPGLFRAAASFSGIVHTRLSPARSRWYRQLIHWQGADPDALWDDPQDWISHNPYDLAPSLRGTALFLSVGNGRPGPYDPPGTPVDDVEAALAARTPRWSPGSGSCASPCGSTLRRGNAHRPVLAAGAAPGLAAAPRRPSPSAPSAMTLAGDVVRRTGLSGTLGAAPG